MEGDYYWDMFWKIFWVVVVVGTVRVALRKMKDKRKLTDLAMYATVEAEKQKWEKEERSADPSTGSGQAVDS